MSSPPALRARGLRRSFGRHEAVAGLDVTVRRGSILGLLGPNGSGKSTTVRLLTGLLRPDAGTIDRLGEPLTAQTAPRLRRRVGVQTDAALRTD